jgi:hypothetical protein
MDQSRAFGLSKSCQVAESCHCKIMPLELQASRAGDMTGVSQDDLDSISRIPILLQAGDFDPARITLQRNFCARPPRASIARSVSLSLLGVRCQSGANLRFLWLIATENPLHRRRRSRVEVCGIPRLRY